MRKIYTIFIFMTTSIFSFSQLETEVLDFNNGTATLTNGGVFFKDETSSNPGYEIPSGSGNHTIFEMGFWFGGVDVSDQLKLAASKHTQGGDFFPGALTTDGSAEVPISETASKGVYLISKSEIDNHIENFDEVGYLIPTSILDWPAHGDVSLGLDFYLAPFVDVNGDGIYNPANGDYPKIKGDQAVYMILNDKGGEHESGGEQIGLEIHYLFYQYASDDFLNNTTFINMRVINRGTQTLYGFKGACYLDSDIGFADDDYAGCYAESNVMFGYNADSFDEGAGGASGYGANPPAVGVVLLNRDIYAFATGGYFYDDTPATHYNYMNAIWPDGVHFTEGGAGYGGDVETNFIFNGNPNNPEDWSEVSAGTIGIDRRMMMSTDLDILHPNEVICLDYAVLYYRDGSPMQNAEGIINMADDVQSFYNSDDFPYCASGILGIEREDLVNQLQIYPNPSNGNFTIDMDGNYNLEIIALDGRIVYVENNLVGTSTIASELTNGIYLVQITQNNNKYQSKIIIRN